MTRKLVIAVPVVLLILVVAAGQYRLPQGILCDAPHPVWMADPCDASATPPSLLDYFWPPDHWNAPTRGGLQGPVDP